MGELARLFVEWIQFLWPFRMVQQWERGGYYLFGRYWRDVPAGVYPVVPWFTDVRSVSVVPAILSTPRLDITLSDGSTLTFAASATARVADFHLAVNTIDDFQETTQELVGAVLADKLADVDAERLEPERRRRLLSDLKRWVANEAATFGVEITELRFTTFVLRVRAYRLMQDTAGNVW